MIITMNTCIYPEINIIGCLDLQSVSNKNLKKMYKNKNIFLPFQIFFRRLLETHILFF